MFAPIYTQSEADRLIYLPKRVDWSAWGTRMRGRPTLDEISAVIEALPEDGTPGIHFKIELRQNNRTDAFSITLQGEMLPKPMQPLMRYDVQDNIHPNPVWFLPPLIDVGEFHMHSYNERAVREFGRWDACASPLLSIPSGGSPEQQLQRLKGAFVKDLMIKFSDSDTAGSLFRGEMWPL